MPASSVENVVHGILDAWNARDISRMLEHLTDDVEWYDPAMPDPPARGKEAIRRFSESVFVAFPDFAYEVRPPICVAPDGSRCAVPFRITATSTGPLVPPGWAPSGRRVTIDGVDVLDLRGDRACRIHTLFDLIPAAEQLLGVTLRPDPRTVRGRLLVGAQRVAAAWARRRRS